MKHPMTKNAEELLALLREGTNFAVPTPSIGSFAYSDHARAFFSNARTLCNDESSDFAIYGALYSLRHAVELMLKCFVRNSIMDQTLRVLTRPSQTLDDVLRTLQLKKAEKSQLIHALCALRNVLEDKLVAPECHQVNIDRRSAERAIEYIRRHPSTPRECFATAWTSTVWGHDLVELWTQARTVFEDFRNAAASYAQRTGLPSPLKLSEIEPAVELLASIDDGGDGLRYPSSLAGAWYVQLPYLSLDALYQLIEKLEMTSIAYEGARSEAYELATVGCPSPQIET